ncbi:hypothetical_protein (plasmid) [Leishmania braziliensis MHOM/BR/75/M2904]|uniref:Hypothetical_protein n=1 Tax=Leishmania braziliensis MHOM/BR/75/M2904 TaxID=420245 RepID=A0A3P3Z0X7_LEIBR|nr:hypothetical_protein [Leishmania braziliensis MHOM/BR/75/M2904]
MSSDDGLRENEEAVTPSTLDVDVDVDAAPMEEAHALEEQEPNGDGSMNTEEDGARSTATPQVPAEAPELPHAIARLETVEDMKAQEDAATMQDSASPAEALDGVEEEHAADPDVDDNATVPEEGEQDGSASADNAVAEADAAVTRSPIVAEHDADGAVVSASEDGVQGNTSVDNASDVAQVGGVGSNKSESEEVRSDLGVEEEPTAAVSAAADAPPQDTNAGAVEDAPPAAKPPQALKGGTPLPEATAELPTPSPLPPPPRDLPRWQSRQQAPQPQLQQQQRSAAVLHHGATPSASSMSPYTTITGVDGVYDLPEAERISLAAASLTPNTVLAVFRRGGENSHVNRMEIGSYSRYLLSTDHMSPLVFEATFHGHQPTVGVVPRSTLKGFGSGNVTNDYADDGIAARAASASSAHRTYQSPRSTFSAARQTMSDTFADIAASSTTLRRENDMLDDANLSALSVLRRQRRRDPRHGKSVDEQRNYVYYNHRSKGFFVPHDPAPDTVMLQYNHLYSFGDGTRFAPVGSPLNGKNGAAATTAHWRNPHAAPPRTFAETRGSAFPFTASQRQYASYNGTVYGGTAQPRSRITKLVREMSSSSSQTNQRQRAETQKGSSSLRTAKAVDLERLYCTQLPRPRTIEEVMADQPQRYLCGAEGVRGALVQDIERDIEDGKLQWEEVPPAMQKAMTSATTAVTAVAQRRQLGSSVSLPAPSTLSASGRRPRCAESLAMAPNALKSVMGQMRATPATTAASGGAAAKIMTTAPPSPAAEAARVTSSACMTGSAASTSRRMPIGSMAAVAALPAISRLNYTPRPTQRSNPSAFV